MVFKSLAVKSYNNSYWRIGFHILFWLLVFATNVYVSGISFGGFKNQNAVYLLTGKSILALIIFYYPLIYYVFPHLFLKKKYFLTLFYFILLIALYAWIDALGDKYILARCDECMDQLAKTNPGYYNFMQSKVPEMMLGRIASLGLFYQLIILLSLLIAIRVGRSYYRKTIQQLQLSQQNLRLEFDFLKSQINPHFLFNTLNNIYSLVVHDKKKEAAAIIARLSDFMRYALYECNEEMISLQKEVNLLKDYIELEKLRLNQTRVDFRYTSDREDYQIPPLLFMPALENTFKYSADHLPGSRINIDICVSINQMTIIMQNSFDPAKENKPGGIGLQNMQKRLQHYYPNSLSYSIRKNNSLYTMTLICTLS